MLELIRHWLVGITCAAMLVALAESLIPAGSIRRIARLSRGAVLLAGYPEPPAKAGYYGADPGTDGVQAGAERIQRGSGGGERNLDEGHHRRTVRRIYSGQGGRPGHRLQVTVEADGEEEWPIPQSVTVMAA